MLRRSTIIAIAAAIALTAGAPVARAIPPLQIYSEAAVYDATNETWVISSDTFELMVIAATGNFGSIMDVTLVASYYGSAGSVSIMDSGGMLPIDTDYAHKEGFTQGVTTHAEYANADGHIFYDIGDFTSTSDMIVDVNNPGTPQAGQIKTFMVHVTGYEAVHFDAFDHYATGTVGTTSYHLHGTKAPFSHDATGGGGAGGSGGSWGGGGSELPEPGSILLLAGGALALALTGRRKK